MAKQEKMLERKKHMVIKRVAIAASFALIVFILPNTSAGMARAMGNIPMIGEFFKVITVRTFNYDDKNNHAEIEVPKLINKNESTKQATKEINEEIAKIAEQWEKEFKENLSVEGHRDVEIKSEILTTAEDYFTLKLSCFEASGSGVEEDYYYTINLKTGEKMALGDLFQKDTDYISTISENIKEQMREQMEEDDSIVYWLDSKDVPEWDFKAISEDTSFYVNEKNEIVICFNEGDVAPMSMGEVTFVISQDAISSILK